jgi:tetratricopeptide (TPR) repeat protein
LSSAGAIGYSTREVAEVVGLPASRILAWTKSGLLSPERDAKGAFRYSFQDLALLREARGLLDGAVPSRRVRATLRALREQLPPGQPLSAVRISAAGDHIIVRDAGGVWEFDSGQLQIDFGAPTDAGAAAVASERTTSGATAPLAIAADAAPPASADDWYDAALDLEAASLEEARAAYERALALDPGHAEAHLNLGRLLHERGVLAEAEGHYRAAAAADPEGANARYNLGVVLEDRGRTVEAIAAYREALALDDRLAGAHFNLARLCEARGEEADALGHLAAYRRLLASSEADEASD